MHEQNRLNYSLTTRYSIDENPPAIEMSKRTLEDSTENVSQPAKKQRKGFSVGPANLPDGTYRRKSMHHSLWLDLAVQLG